jgi:aminoglycoside phosphotransferase (APT) family kinase protein
MDAGDVLYWEIDRRLPGQLALTPARAFERVRRLGLAPAAAYWVKPGFPDRKMYLPLDSPDALRWYLDTLYRSESVGRRLLKYVFRAVAACGQLGAVAPCYAVIATRGAQSAGARAHTVLLAHASQEWSRVALLPIAGGAAPSSVIKLPRTRVFNEHVEWEHRVQRQLHTMLPPSLQGSIPDSRLVEWRDLTALVETAVPGTPLSTRTGLSTRDRLDDLQITVGWLARFHSATQQARVPARQWLTRRLLEGLCRRYADAFGLTPAEAALFDRLEYQVRTCGAATMPLAWQHTDFGPWNVYRDGQTIRVIDWEVARIGPAVVDLLYFAMHWGAAAARRNTHAEQVQHFSALFCRQNASDLVSRTIRDEVAGYMRRMDIDWSLLPALLAYTVLEQAIDLVRRRTATGAAAHDRASNPYVDYLAAMAGETEALMPRSAA